MKVYLRVIGLGDIGCIHLFKEEVLPVDLLEEAMAFDVLGSVFEVSVSFGVISSQQMLHKALALPTNQFETPF